METGYQIANAQTRAGKGGGSSSPVPKSTVVPSEVDFDSVAFYIELYRLVPSCVDTGEDCIPPSNYMNMVMRDITGMGGPEGWRMPDTIYGSINPTRQVYGEVLVKEEYMEFFENILEKYGDNETIPASFNLRGGKYRFVDALHLAASIKRFKRKLGYLPETMDPKIASPKGLFPWTFPDSLGQYVSGVDGGDRIAGGGLNGSGLYYQSSSMDYEMFSLVDSIIGSETDPYVAGGRIHNWVKNTHYDRTPYGAGHRPKSFGFPLKDYEMIRNMQGTSRTPNFINTGLYPAAGLPYGGNGAVFVEGHGWFNTEFHARYGSDLEDNDYYFGDPKNPEPYNSDYHKPPKVFEISPNSNETTDYRMLWVNPADVKRRGASSIISDAREGGFSRIAITIKTFVGKHYFAADSAAQESFQYDALQDLESSVRSEDIEIYASISVLSDHHIINRTGNNHLAQKKFDGSKNDFYVSPCKPDYKNYIKKLIAEAYKYKIDGVVLSYNYVVRNRWGNEECDFENKENTDSLGTSVITKFVNELGKKSQSVAPDSKVYVLTAPLTNMYGVPFWGDTPRFPANGIYTIQDFSPEELNPSSVDGVILNISNVAWVKKIYGFETQVEGYIFEEYFSIYRNELDPNISLGMTSYLSKEWQFQPKFYNDLARYMKGVGMEGMAVVSNNSDQGELGSAFTRQHYGKIREIDFLSNAQQRLPPPTPQNVSTTLRDSSIVFSWDSVDDAVEYRVLRSQGSEGWEKIGMTLSDRSNFVDSAVVSGAMYKYSVESLDRAGNASSQSESAEATFVSRTVDEDGIVSFGDTGATLDFSGVGGVGTVTIAKVTEGAADTSGISEENVSDFRFVIEVEDALDFDSTEARFAISSLTGIEEDPSNVTIYKRSQVGTGTFEMLETSVDDGGTPGDISDDVLLATVDSFSEFAVASDSEPLPVEMAGFEATIADKNAVRLTWTTASETGNVGFHVQRTVGEVEEGSWKTVGSVEGEGTTTDPTSYRHVDEGLPYEADRLTYRLRQVDTDGTLHFSKTVAVERGVGEVELLGTYPNPARTQATLRYALPERQDVTIRLYDMLGREVRTVASGRQEGRHERQMDLSALPSGTYFLRLDAEGQTETQQVTVVR